MRDCQNVRDEHRSEFRTNTNDIVIIDYPDGICIVYRDDLSICSSPLELQIATTLSSAAPRASRHVVAQQAIEEVLSELR